jgi:beta-xylosidase
LLTLAVLNKSMTLTYTNPVYPDYFADPFVWKHEGVYFAIGTGPHEAEGAIDAGSEALVFPLLTSHDLVTWHSAGKALYRLDPSFGDSYWAPEVAFHDGTFYLYYSVGHEDKNHQLRVATSTAPLGPYANVGTPLIDSTTHPFAIDPHPFRDDDDNWYLFYARDFLDSENGLRSGTALVVDKLENMTRLASNEKTVLRACHDWQRFLKDRQMYDGIYDWHTLEGASVVKHEGKYYCLYSGGRWENETYGVDYGVADNVLGPYSDEGNESGARILRTQPGKVLGPGHNSLVLGPDDKTLFIAYHAWDTEMTARRLCLDPLIWTHDGPRSNGPTYTPQTIEV